MTHGGQIGFLASALVLAAFGMKDMVNLRIVAICSNFAFIAYALLLHAAHTDAPRHSSAAQRLALGTSLAAIGLQPWRDDAR
jgi:hypothetical protein